MDTKKTTNPNKTATNSIPHMLPNQCSTLMIDLHGLSAEQAKATVTRYVKLAPSSGWDKIRFVTGRGNHLNARGERGTLYKNFKDWLQVARGNVAKIDQFDGYYEVDIQNDIRFRNPFMALMNDSVEQLLKENIEKIKTGSSNHVIEDMLALALCYDKGIGVAQNYSNATKLYLILAKKGDAASQYEAGNRYFIGKGIKQDDSKALEFLILSSNQDFVLAEFLLGEIYWKGFGSYTIDFRIANQYYRKAANHGHAEAARKLGCAYAKVKGVDKPDDAAAIYWWEKAVEGSDCVAAFNLYGFYREGKGTKKNLKKAIDNLHLSAEWNDPDGQCILGELYYYGDEAIKQDKATGLKWLHRAADNVCPQAQFILFQHYKLLKDEKKSIQYLIDAAENGQIEAQFLIGCAPSDEAKSNSANENVNDSRSTAAHAEKKAMQVAKFSPDLQKKMAANLLKQSITAVLRTDSTLQSIIVTLLLCDDSTQKQIKKGVNILEKLADEKNHLVLDRLGSIYVIGMTKGIKQDIDKGYQYWLQGAAVDDPNCLCALGYFWQEGMGGKIDKLKAIDYFLKSADKGNANANNLVGTFYRSNTFGVKKDPKKAADYYRRAMELDKPSERHHKKMAFCPNQNVFKYASQNLAFLYFDGDDDFPKNEETAIALFKQSAADGMNEAAFILAMLYNSKKQPMEFACYLNLAADLGNIEARALLKKINPPAADNKDIKQLLYSMLNNPVPESAATSKEKMCAELHRISDCLAEPLDWKITTTNSAWTYISDDLQKKLNAITELKEYVKKSKDGPYLIIIKAIDHCHLDTIASLFKRAMAPFAPKNSADTATTAVATTLFDSKASQQYPAASANAATVSAENSAATCTIM